MAYLSRAGLLLVLFVLSLTLSASTDAAVLYVNDASRSGDSFTTAPGSDLNSGATPSRPKLTVASAMAAARSGDVIMIDAGRYDEEMPAVKNGVRIVGAERRIARVRDPRSGRSVMAAADEIIVKYRPAAPEAGRDRVRRGRSLTVARRIGRLGSEKLRMNAGEDLRRLISELRNDPDVEYVEPNYVVEMTAWPSNDPMLAQEWGLAAVKIPEAWASTSGDASVLVAVLDSGIDSGHPDLAGQVVSGRNTMTDNAMTMDDNGHGTMVAGVIAARAGNALGIAGAAPGCRLLPVKVLDRSGMGTYADVAEGIIYAADNGAKVINLSLGGSSPSQFLQDAVDYARSKGCVVVAAAGNFNSDIPMYPAACGGVLSVAAVGMAEEKASFSNYGATVDVAAPGVSVLSTDSGNAWTSVNGTSFAAPFVSAGAALVYARFPGLTSDSVTARIVNAARDIGSPGRDDYFGHGLLDIAAALNESASETMPQDKFDTRFVATLRPITPEELAEMKRRAGTYDPKVNYNVIFGEFGTGLAPPTEAGWNAMASDAMIAELALPASEVARQLAPSCDNSTTNWFPPILSQGQEGSCTAWSTVYYMKTFHEAKEHNWNVHVAPGSNQVFSPEFVYHQINYGGSNGTWQSDNISVMNRIGAATWATCPNSTSNYSAWPSDAAWREAPLYRAASRAINVWVRDDAGVTAVKNLISAGHLVSINIDANCYYSLDGNDLCTVEDITSSMNHANTIVGYDDNFGPYTEQGQSRTGAFKVANSWGLGFPGDHNSDGMWWLSYAAFKSLYYSYATYYLDSTAYAPKLVATANVSHPARSDCIFTFGFGSTAVAGKYKQFDLNMGGAASISGTKMVFDLTEIANVMPGETMGFLTVYDRATHSSVGCISDFTFKYFNNYDSAALAADSTFDSPDVPKYTTNNGSSYQRVFIDNYVPNVWYVNDASTSGDQFCSAVGSGANDGRSPASPKRSITEVMMLASPGDTVYIDSGVYAEAVVISDDSISLIGASAGTYSGSIIDPPGYYATSGSYGIYASGKKGLLIKDIGIKSGQYGIRFVNCDSSIIDGCVSLNNTFGISLEQGSNMNVVTGCSIATNMHCGLYLNASCSNVMVDNVMSRNTNAGFFAIGASNSNVILRNISDTSVFGIYFYGNCKRNYVYNNITRGNSHIALYSKLSDQTNFDSNYVAGSASGIFNIYCTNDTTVNNIVRNSANFAIYLYDCDDQYVDGNLIVGGSGTGFCLNSCNRVTAGHNHISGVSGVGAWFRLCDDINFARNTVESSSIYQIGLDMTATSESICLNNFIPRGTVDSLVLCNPTSTGLVDLRNNWWGSADPVAVKNRMTGAKKYLIDSLPIQAGPVDTSGAMPPGPPPGMIAQRNVWFDAPTPISRQEGWMDTSAREIEALAFEFMEAPAAPQRIDLALGNGRTRTEARVRANAVNTVLSTNGLNSVEVTLPAGALSALDDSLVIVVNRAASSSPNGKSAVGGAADISLASGQRIFANGNKVEVKLSYSDTNADGIVDGSTARASELEIWSLSSGSWEKLESISVDTAACRVSGLTSHFSEFVVVGPAAAASLSGFTVSPNPYRPNLGNQNTGLPYQRGVAGTGIYFMNLPAAVELKIMSITGELVAEYSTSNSGGSIQWDVKNHSGRDVASGYYLYVVTNTATGERVTGKLAVIR